MGSLNINGTAITQKLITIRYIGGSLTESADRIEIRTVISPGNTLFSSETPNEDLVQTSSTKLYDCIKLTNSKTDGLVNRVCITDIDL